MLLPRIVCTIFLINFATSVIVETSKEAPNITSYDPGELLAKIFNYTSNITSRHRGYGLVFEGQSDPQADEDHNKKLKFEDDSQNLEDNNGPIRFEDDNFQNTNRNPERPMRFEDEDRDRNQGAFQDNNNINQNNKRKKRRRRRKPKNGPQNYPQNFQGVHQNYQGLPGGAGFQGPSFGTIPYPGLGPNPNGNPGFPGPVPFRRRRRPKPSLASDALTAVTGALTSIALYDDYQCVPRLLCEAAGGGSLGSNGVLDSIAGIQPLLTLLSAYNGISASPLFVFGQAVFLGMTSRGNTGTCRYAYPQCPTDPEQLIHYLNNHNGGFFRFFNAPLPNQNLEQFYDHLGQNGQSLEQFNNNLGQNGQYGQYGQDFGQSYQQNYGLYSQQNYQQGQNYGLYQNQPLGQQGYGFHNIGHSPGQYGQNYGSNYDYNTYGSNVRFKANAKIEKRIQNNPVKNDDEYLKDQNENIDTKWLFPEQNDSTENIFDNNERDKETLKFPEESQTYDDKRDSTRKGKSILFPENQYNYNAYSNKNYQNPINKINFDKGQTARPYYVVNTNIYKHTTASPFNKNDYYYDHKHNFYVKKEQNSLNYNNPYNKNQIQIQYSNNYDKNQNSYYNSNNRDQNQLYNNNHYNKAQSQGNYVNYNNHGNSKIKDDGVQTVYIVRGNGDPSMPEIVNVRPGQTVN